MKCNSIFCLSIKLFKLIILSKGSVYHQHTYCNYLPYYRSDMRCIHTLQVYSRGPTNAISKIYYKKKNWPGCYTIVNGWNIHYPPKVWIHLKKSHWSLLEEIGRRCWEMQSTTTQNHHINALKMFGICCHMTHSVQTQYCYSYEKKF